MAAFGFKVVLAALLALIGARLWAGPRDFAFVWVVLFSVSLAGIVLLTTSLWRDYAVARRELRAELARRRQAELAGAPPPEVPRPALPAGRAHWVELPAEDERAG